MSSAVAQIVVPVPETEAFKELLARVGRKAGNIPPELFVQHVLDCVPAHEWPTRLDAMEAIVRRLRVSPARENLRVEARPARGRLLGLYVTRRLWGRARASPYRTVLLGIEPIEGRCDCPDFLKNSLGLCKHLLVVLDHLHTRPRVLQQARKEQEWTDPSSRTGLCWDPFRPLTGIGDWLDRVEWRGDFESRKGTLAEEVAPDCPLVSPWPRRQCALEKQLPRQARPPSRARRGPAQDRARRRQRVAA